MALTTREKIMAGIVVAVIIISAVVVLTMTRRIPTVGRIKAIGVEVYWDPDCSEVVESIDWGTMRPGDLAGVTLYFENIRNTNCTLSLNSSNWVPLIAEQYLTLDWNYTDVVMEPEDVLTIQLTLYASTDTEGFTSFSFDILITAVEVE